MSFVGQFSISQGTDVQSFSITDTSVGSDPNLTGRKIYLYLSDGTTLIPAGSSTPYINWPLVSGIGDVITLTGILKKDYAINVTVVWASSSPLAPPSIYIYAILKAFVGNLKLFSFGLSQLQSGNPLLINDNGYFPNREKLDVLIDDASNAITYNDQFTSQRSLDAGYKMQQNQKSFF